MNHFQHTAYVDACREKGFVDLAWEEGVIDKINGMYTDRATLIGEKFEIYITLSHPYVKDPARQKEFDETRFTGITIHFTYLTEMGPLSYIHSHRANPYERAKEYAIWQATMIYETLCKL